MEPMFIEGSVAGGVAVAVPARHREEAGAAAKNDALAGFPWWMWPHLLSLDAPLVALVWQRWLARAGGTVLPVSREVVLWLGVWLIYLADRLADSARSDGTDGAAPRHVFSGDRRRLLRPLASLVAAALTTLTPCWLPRDEFLAGLWLLASAAGYFWLIHCWPVRGWAGFLPKEAVVGAMFGAGTAFFVVCRSPHLSRAFWLGTGLFGSVCFLNCALITRWERHAHDLHERSSLLNAFPRLSARLGAVAILLAAASLGACWLTDSPVAAPAAVSALLLACLDRRSSRLSADALRVLADLVLLTPWLFWAAA